MASLKIGHGADGRILRIGTPGSVVVSGEDAETTALGFWLCCQAAEVGLDVLHLDPRLLPEPQVGFGRFRSVSGDPRSCLQALMDFRGPGMVFLDHASRLLLYAEDSGWIDHLEALGSGPAVVVVADPGRLPGSEALRAVGEVEVVQGLERDLICFGSARVLPGRVRAPKQARHRMRTLDTDSISC